MWGFAYIQSSEKRKNAVQNAAAVRIRENAAEIVKKNKKQEATGIAIAAPVVFIAVNYIDIFSIIQQPNKNYKISFYSLNAKIYYKLY